MYQRLSHRSPAPAVGLSEFHDAREYDAFVWAEVVEKL
jgi:hypothetical protein